MFHVKHEVWAADLASLGLALPRDRLDSLSRYVDLLHERAIPRGMIGAGDADRLWHRHVLDGLRGAREIAEGSVVADLGSGAGIPGVPLGIAMPRCRFALVESRRGRAAFLESVVDDLHLTNVEVVLGMAQDLPPAGFDVVVARAFASAIETWAAAEPLLRPHGYAVYWAGAGLQERELGSLGAPWRVSTPSGLAESGPLIIMGQQ